MQTSEELKKKNCSALIKAANPYIPLKYINLTKIKTVNTFNAFLCQLTSWIEKIKLYTKLWQSYDKTRSGQWSCSLT